MAPAPGAAMTMEELMFARATAFHPEPGRSEEPPSEVAPGGGAEPQTQAERAARSLAQGLEGRREEPFEIQLLEATLDHAAALEVVSAAFVPRFADWAFIHIVDEAGIARRVKVAHADPADAALADEFRSLAPEPGKATITGQSIRDRSPRLVREVSEHVLRWAAHDHRHYRALKALAPRSILAVPLLARGRCVGGITLMRTGAPGFAEADLLEAQKLTAAAALALENAERFARALAAAAPARLAAAPRQKRAPRSPKAKPGAGFRKGARRSARVSAGRAPKKA
jgi:GAF domain-containing protein